MTIASTSSTSMPNVSSRPEGELVRVCGPRVPSAFPRKDGEVGLRAIRAAVGDDDVVASIAVQVARGQGGRIDPDRESNLRCEDPSPLR